MKILVLGAGRMGHGAVFDLAHNSPEVEAVTIADADFTKAQSVAENIKSAKVTALRLDVFKLRRCRRFNARTRRGDFLRQLLA